MESQSENQIVTGTAGSEFDRVLTLWEPFGFSGVVLALDHGRPVLRKGYGFSRWLEQIPNFTDTMVPIASVSKQFTAAAILNLELEGGLLISDPISKYLGEFHWERGIPTIHHLLTHTSGLIRSDTRFASTNRCEYVDKLKQTRRESPPGERYRYANGGYSALAAIIEQVSGGTYQRYLVDHLFLPAGMLRTRFIDQIDFEDLRIAHGHYISESQIHSALNSSFPAALNRSSLEAPRPSPPVSCDWSIITSGGMVTTLSDMEAWDQQLVAHGILSADAVNKLFTPYVKSPDSEDAYQSYGWTVGHTKSGVKFAGIYGDYQGYQSAYMRYRGGELVLFFAANAALEGGGAGGWRLPVRDLFERLFL